MNPGLYSCTGIVVGEASYELADSARILLGLALRDFLKAEASKTQLRVCLRRSERWPQSVPIRVMILINDGPASSTPSDIIGWVSMPVK